MPMQSPRGGAGVVLAACAETDRKGERLAAPPLLNKRRPFRSRFFNTYAGRPRHRRTRTRQFASSTVTPAQPTWSTNSMISTGT